MKERNVVLIENVGRWRLAK